MSEEREAALMVHVERLRGALRNMIDLRPNGPTAARCAEQALAATPVQSLETLRAEAGRARAVQELRKLSGERWVCATSCRVRADEIEHEGQARKEGE